MQDFDAGMVVKRPKFSDPAVTATGERRAIVPFDGLQTLWFNTGTLCNITCTGCYIESSPSNDSLVYLSRADVATFLDEAAGDAVQPREIGFTGGEPFMNPEFLGMLEDSLARGFKCLVLTNAMKPMQLKTKRLAKLNERFPGLLTLRVSVDHYNSALHEKVRGERTWQPTLDGLRWLQANGFDLAVAGRLLWTESETALRHGFAGLFDEIGLAVDADDRSRLVLFPEMDAAADVPEISEGCWKILHKRPGDVMCATSRMVVKHKGAVAPVVVSCTLLPYAAEFALGATLADAARPVTLNHPHCARFCVLGGASCSG